MYRDNTKVVKIGNKLIGGGNPIMIQSMTNTRTDDVEATVRQILALEKLMPLKQSRRLRSIFIFHWLQIYILITEWQ